MHKALREFVVRCAAYKEKADKAAKAAVAQAATGIAEAPAPEPAIDNIAQQLDACTISSSSPKVAQLEKAFVEVESSPAVAPTPSTPTLPTKSSNASPGSRTPEEKRIESLRRMLSMCNTPRSAMKASRVAVPLRDSSNVDATSELCDSENQTCSDADLPATFDSQVEKLSQSFQRLDHNDSSSHEPMLTTPVRRSSRLNKADGSLVDDVEPTTPLGRFITIVPVRSAKSIKVLCATTSLQRLGIAGVQVCRFALTIETTR
jgi:hypothetical protein